MMSLVSDGLPSIESDIISLKEYFGLSTYDETSSLEMNRYNKNRKDKEKHHQENHTNFIALDRIKGIFCSLRSIHQMYYIFRSFL